MAADEVKFAAEFAATSLRFALTPQLAFVGQLLSALVTSGVMSKDEAADVISELADTIASPLNEPASDFQAILINPVREHAEALRKLASDLNGR